jgi:ABC-type dipeptide/oligopeptide/nickel transport system permease component
VVGYIIRRLVYGVVTLLALSIVVFTVIQLGGGSPLDRLRQNPRIKAEQIARLSAHFGLNKPAWQQFLIWLKGFVTPIPVVQETVNGNQYAFFWRFGVQGWGPLVGFVAAVGASLGIAFVKVRDAWWPTFRKISIPVLLVASTIWLILSTDYVNPVQSLDTDNLIPFWRLGFRGLAPIMSLVIAAVITAAMFLTKIERPWWRTFRAFSLTGVWLIAVWFAHSRIAVSLDWSDSFRGDGPVWDYIFGAAGATFRLGVASLLLALIIGIPLGIYQAIRQYSFFDQLGTTFSFIAFSTPIFIVGVGLQLLLASYLDKWTGVKLFFVAGMTETNYAALGRIHIGPLELPSLAQFGDITRHLALPTIAIALISIAQYSRFQRASMLEVMHSDYLRTAKAKGLPRRRVIVKHALRNAMIPIVTLVSLDVAAIIGGAIITETIFGWPGIGRAYIGAINAIDYPVVMAVVMAIGIGIVVMNLFADIMYGVLDPRVRYD